MRTIRIGSGAGYSGDRIELALEVAEVVRYELPNIAALNFVMNGALGGGVTRSLAPDAHGKSLSSALLDTKIDAVSKDE
jgi:hypothetical protein